MKKKKWHGSTLNQETANLDKHKPNSWLKDALIPSPLHYCRPSNDDYLKEGTIINKEWYLRPWHLWYTLKTRYYVYKP